MAGKSLLGEAFVEIRPSFDKFSGELKSGIVTASKTATSGAGAAFNELAAVGKGAFLGLAGAATTFGLAAVHAAIKGEQANAGLRNAIQNVGQSYEEVEPAVERTTQQFAKFGYENDQVELALTRLVQITGSTTKAVSLMGLTADVAAARHMDLSDAAQLVGRVAGGNLTLVMRSLGIQLQSTGDKTRDAAKALEVLRERFGGAAQAQADTYAGKLRAFRAEVENLTEKVGFALLPVLGEVASVMGGAIGFFERNHAAAVALGIVIGGPLVAAMTAFLVKETLVLATNLVEFFQLSALAAQEYAAGTYVAGTATESLSGAMGTLTAAAGPLGLLAAATVAVGLGISKIGAQQPNVQKMTQALLDLGQTGAVTGQVLNTFGPGLKDLGSEVDDAKKKSDGWLNTHIFNPAPWSVWSGGMRQASSDLKSVDKSLAGLVQGGNPELAAGIFQALSTAYVAQGGKVENLNKVLPKYTGLLLAQGTAAKVAADGTGETTDSAAALGISLTDLGAALGVSVDFAAELAAKLGIDLTKATSDQVGKIAQLSARVQILTPQMLALSDAMTTFKSRTADAGERASAFDKIIDNTIGSNIDLERSVVGIGDKFASLTDSLAKNGSSFDTLTAKGRANTSAVEDAVVAIRAHVEAVFASTGSAKEARKAYDDDTKSLRALLGTTQNLTEAQRAEIEKMTQANPVTLQLNTALSTLRDTTQDATSKAQAFRQAFDLLVGGPLAEDKAVITLQQRLQGLGKTIIDNGRNLDYRSEAGQNDLLAVQDLVSGIRDHIEAMRDAGRGSDDLRKAFDGDVQSLKDQLKYVGFTDEQIDSLIQHYGLVPSSIDTVIKADTAPAANSIDQFVGLSKSKIDDLLAHYNLVPKSLTTVVDADTSLAVSKLEALSQAMDVLAFQNTPLGSYHEAFQNAITPNAGKPGGAVAVLGYGGYFPGGHPQLAIVGDRREVMLPLDDPGRMAELMAMAGIGGSVSVAAQAETPTAAPSVHVPIGPFYNTDVSPSQLAKRVAFEVVEAVQPT